MIRSDSRYEEIKDRDRLVKILYLTNKKSGTRPMTYKQCGAVADTIISGKTTQFCGRLFEVRA